MSKIQSQKESIFLKWIIYYNMLITYAEEKFYL